MIELEVRIKKEVQLTLEEFQIDYLLNVPCSILDQYFNFNNLKKIRTIQLSREEEGVGVASGLTVSGKKVVLAMQNSGFGNCINAFASLCIPYEINFIVIISMRGDKNELNPVQIPMGKATKQILTSLELSYIEVNGEMSFYNAFKIAYEKLTKDNKTQFILLPRIESLYDE